MNAPIDKYRERDRGQADAARPRWANEDEWRTAENIPFIPTSPIAEAPRPQNLDQLAAQLAALVPPSLPPRVHLSQTEQASPLAWRYESERPEARRITHPQASDAMPPWMQKSRKLEPALPEPPLEQPARLRLGSAVRAFALTMVAAGGAYVLVYGVPQPLKGSFLEQSSVVPASESASAPKAARLSGAKLVAGDIRGNAGDWIPLNMAIEGKLADGEAVITGFVPGTTLSMGAAAGSNGWRIRLADLPKLQAHFPPNFSGGMDLVVELRRGDAAVIDRKAVRLDVVNARLAPASVGPSQPTSSQGSSQTSAPPSGRAGEEAIGALPQNPATAATEESHAPARRLDPAEVTVLLRRGEELVKNGDLAGARLLLQRAAEARHGGAAFALASTYDPLMLKHLPVLGLNGDVGLARQWYERARELGIKEAAARLEALAGSGR